MVYLLTASLPVRRGSASLTTGRVVLAAALALSCASARAEPHDEEIKTFAGTMAIARTVREECPGTAPDDGMLEAVRMRLHIVEADHPAFAPEANAAAEMLKRSLAGASSRQEWCDAFFRLYGPDGTLLRGMLRR